MNCQLVSHILLDTVHISYSLTYSGDFFTWFYTKPHAKSIYVSLVYRWTPDGASYFVKFSITIERIGSVISY